MDSSLHLNPLWPSALGTVEAHFRRWRGESGQQQGTQRGTQRAKTGATAQAWTSLAGDLTALGLDKATRDTLLGWVDSVASRARQEPLKMRLLHPMEREMLTTEAYGYLLEIYRLGLLGILGFEQVLELCATLTRLPATREQVQFLTSRVLSDTISSEGFATAH